MSEKEQSHRFGLEYDHPRVCIGYVVATRQERMTRTASIRVTSDNNRATQPDRKYCRIGLADYAKIMRTTLNPKYTIRARLQAFEASLCEWKRREI